jgi:hypothetical protein
MGRNRRRVRPFRPIRNLETQYPSIQIPIPDLHNPIASYAKRAIASEGRNASSSVAVALQGASGSSSQGDFLPPNSRYNQSQHYFHQRGQSYSSALSPSSPSTDAWTRTGSSFSARHGAAASYSSSQFSTVAAAGTTQATGLFHGDEWRTSNPSTNSTSVSDDAPGRTPSPPFHAFYTTGVTQAGRFSLSDLDDGYLSSSSTSTTSSHFNSGDASRYADDAAERHRRLLFGGEDGDEVSLCSKMEDVVVGLFGALDYIDP